MDSRERDLKNSKLGLTPQKTDELVDKLVEFAMKERRKNMIRSPKGGSPQYMREDPTTPLIHEVPFGPDTRMIESPEHGNPKNYNHISHSPTDTPMKDSDEFLKEQNKLPKDKQFPQFGDITGKGSKMMMDTTKGHEVDAHSFRVIPHGGISIPKEQERIVRPKEKRNYEHGRLKARSNRSHQKDEDAKEIALDIQFDEKPNRFVNRVTHKIRPNKPVRSDFTSIISAKNGFRGIIKKETTFKVAENNKPEYVSVTPLSFRTKKGKRYPLRNKSFK